MISSTLLTNYSNLGCTETLVVFRCGPKRETFRETEEVRWSNVEGVTRSVPRFQLGKDRGWGRVSCRDVPLFVPVVLPNRTHNVFPEVF